MQLSLGGGSRGGQWRWAVEGAVELAVKGTVEVAVEVGSLGGSGGGAVGGITREQPLGKLVSVFAILAKGIAKMV
jgi:hypothetical protein